VTQTRDSVLLDVIGLRGSHVNPQLVARPARSLMCQLRAGRIKSPTPTRRRPSEFSDGPLIGSPFGVAWASRKISLSPRSFVSPEAHRLTFEEFHEAFGKTKSVRPRSAGRASLIRALRVVRRAHARVAARVRVDVLGAYFASGRTSRIGCLAWIVSAD